MPPSLNRRVITLNRSVTPPTFNLDLTEEEDQSLLRRILNYVPNAVIPVLRLTHSFVRNHIDQRLMYHVVHYIDHQITVTKKANIALLPNRLMEYAHHARVLDLHPRAMLINPSRIDKAIPIFLNIRHARLHHDSDATFRSLVCPPEKFDDMEYFPRLSTIIWRPTLSSDSDSATRDHEFVPTVRARRTIIPIPKRSDSLNRNAFFKLGEYFNPDRNHPQEVVILMLQQLNGNPDHERGWAGEVDLESSDHLEQQLAQLAINPGPSRYHDFWANVLRTAYTHGAQMQFTVVGLERAQANHLSTRFSIMANQATDGLHPPPMFLSLQEWKREIHPELWARLIAKLPSCFKDGHPCP